MKLSKELFISMCAFAILIGTAIYAAPWFIATLNVKKPKPLAIESLKIDKDVSFFHQPVFPKSHERPTCWYQIHGMQSKSGPHRFTVECELFARLKTRLTVPQKKESQAALNIIPSLTIPSPPP